MVYGLRWKVKGWKVKGWRVEGVEKGKLLRVRRV